MDIQLKKETTNKMFDMKKIIPFIMATALLASCNNASQDPSGKAPTQCRVFTVERADRMLNTEYAASLEGRQIVEIRPQVSGNITRICIGEGDAVKRGQTLFVIDQVPYKAALAVAKANVESAEAKVTAARMTAESKEQLYAKSVVSEFDMLLSKSELATAEAALAQAKAQVTNAANNLSYTEVKSPVDGKAGMIAYRVGALVSSNITTPLVTVSDDSEVYAYFSVNEKRLLDMTAGSASTEEFVASIPEVSLLLSNGMPYTEKGHVAAVSGIVDRSTGAVSLRADFPNTGGQLRHGGTATVVMPSSLHDVMVIPQTATYEIQEKKFVFRVVDGVAHSQEVQVYRLNDGHEYVVESGLQPGDVIVAEGAGLMKDGTKIEVKQ